jgi:type IV pilus assembly protein PilV
MYMKPSLFRQRGASLIEVLVTAVVLAFGLLGIAVFQSKSQVGSLESYQRAQAVILLQDMTSRLKGNLPQAANYVVNDVGTGDTRPADCSAAAAGADHDLCEWSKSLKGAAEVDSNNKVGAMIGARGCIEQLQAADASAGVCRPATYQVTVAWQGMHATIAPSLACGQNRYGTDTNRRAIAVQITSPLLNCQ